jgi:epoxyqueuosine reductase
MRPLLGDWIWGCDLCQDVCPPTRLAHTAGASAFAASDAAAAFPNLVKLLELRSGEFKRRYARSAMGWRGAAVLRRNAAVALGNALDRSAVPALERALANDPHAMVRGHVAWALGRIGSPRALAALQTRRGEEGDAEASFEIELALRAWKPSPAARR